MKQHNTILEKIGISDVILEKWKKKGLHITYPMKARRSYFKSQDGEVFIESADKYVPPLTKEETKLYTKHPEIFREDFLKNAVLYYQFHRFLFEKSQAINKLVSPREKISAALALTYLFLSAMDHHYYHFDRYLVYEEYPSTPVGYWWNKLKNLYFKAFKEKISKTNTTQRFLKILSLDKRAINSFKNRLNTKESTELNKTLTTIKIFENTQEQEIKIVSGYPANEDLLLKTGFSLWTQICNLIKRYPEIVQSTYLPKINTIINGHPITATRAMLLSETLHCFDSKVYKEFVREISRWTH